MMSNLGTVPGECGLREIVYQGDGVCVRTRGMVCVCVPGERCVCVCMCARGKVCVCVCVHGERCVRVCVYQGDDALLVLLLASHHGVALACPCLAVGEDADVVALEGVLQHLHPDVPVHLQLGRVIWVLTLHTNTHTS